MPGLRNPLSVSGAYERLRDVLDRVHDNKQDPTESGFVIHYSDLTIQFIGASGLPKMDVVGLADPYFVADIDNQVSFVSTVQPCTLTPVWNEIWKVRNVPSTATIFVRVLDKDDGSVTDDYIGKFRTSVSPGSKEAEIEGPTFHLRERGTFWLKIESTPSQSDPKRYPYLFDGPIRFSQHYSPTVGRLTNPRDARLYSTWKVYIKGVPIYFEDHFQPWNSKYKAAQSIFQGPTSIAVRSGIQAGHRMLYARNTTNGFGVLNDSKGLLTLLQSSSSRSKETPTGSQRVQPTVYTYVIAAEDNSLRFSETGAAFFIDFASKHALHSNCAEKVRYSGEFHPRPKGGWDNFNDDGSDEQVDWEIVMDNNSGTYGPDIKLLPNLRSLMEHNFPDIHFVALDFQDPELTRSREACREYALNHRGMNQEEMQPHLHMGEGEVALHQAVGAAANTICPSN